MHTCRAALRRSTANVTVIMMMTMSTPKKTPMTIPAMAPLLSNLAAAVLMVAIVLGGGGAAAWHSMSSFLCVKLQFIKYHGHLSECQAVMQYGWHAAALAGQVMAPFLRQP